MSSILTEGGSDTLQRVEWTEPPGLAGETDQYLFVAEIQHGQLNVYERSEWEVRYLPVYPAAEMRAKIEQLFSERALS